MTGGEALCSTILLEVGPSLPVAKAMEDAPPLTVEAAFVVASPLLPAETALVSRLEETPPLLVETALEEALPPLLVTPAIPVPPPYSRLAGWKPWDKFSSCVGGWD